MLTNNMESQDGAPAWDILSLAVLSVVDYSSKSFDMKASQCGGLVCSPLFGREI